MFGPVPHVGRQHSAVARIAEHCRKHDDAHDNPEREKYVRNDQEPPVYAHLFIILKAGDAKETAAMPLSVRRLSQHEHPLSITPDIRSPRANFSHYRSIGRREMMGSCKCGAAVNRGKEHNEDEDMDGDHQHGQTSRP